MNVRLSLKEAILYAVNAVVSNPWYFIKLILAWIGFSILLMLSIAALVLTLVFMSFFSPLLLIIGVLLIYVFGVFIWVLPAKILLRFFDKGPEPLSLGYFFSQFNFGMLIKILGAAVLFSFIVVAGLLLLIIPGIYLAVKFIFVFFIILDTNCGIIEAFKKSYTITTNNFWRVFALLLIISILLNLVILFPVSVLMLIHAYRQLNP
jgi:uncharacterized membrane protein